MEKVRCFDCGELVNSVWDHIDVDCLGLGTNETE